MNSLKKVRMVFFDFDGVFTDNRVVVSDNGRESVVCCRSDGLGLRRLDSVAVKYMIISSEKNRVVEYRARKLGVDCVYGVDDKLNELKKAAQEKNVPLAAVAYLGNDINDSDCLKAVGFPVVVADAWDEVRPLAVLVLKRNGGFGAVRELCDMVWRAKRLGRRAHGVSGRPVKG